MPLAFLLDEHLRGNLWDFIQTHNQAGSLVIDAERIGDTPDLPLGTKDPVVLVWAEQHGRIILSRDFRTMPGHFNDHLAAGRHSPGVALLRPSASLAEIVSYLAVAAHAAEAYEFADAVRVIPEA